MAQAFPEKAHLKTDMKKFGEEHERIFGEPEKQFCDHCEKRFAFCECSITLSQPLDPFPHVLD
jgi:hypothetical protein